MKDLDKPEEFRLIDGIPPFIPPDEGPEPEWQNKHRDLLRSTIMPASILPEAQSAEENTFQKELEQLINKHSMEEGSNTPDFILAQFLHQCLVAFNEGVRRREEWYGYVNSPAGGFST